MTVIANSSAGTAELLRRTLRRHACGVTVVTLPGPAGFTATSFTSVSLHPPLITFFVGASASAAPTARRAGHFGVHLLRAGQAEIARQFAGRSDQRFTGLARTEGPDGVPLLDGVDRLVARTVSVRPVGDHLQIIGEVVEAAVHHPDGPLVYHDGDYATAARLDGPIR